MSVRYVTSAGSQLKRAESNGSVQVGGALLVRGLIWSRKRYCEQGPALSIRERMYGRRILRGGGGSIESNRSGQPAELGDFSVGSSERSYRPVSAEPDPAEIRHAMLPPFGGVLWGGAWRSGAISCTGTDIAS